MPQWIMTTGALMVIFGLLVIAFPYLLVVMVASFFIITGLTTLIFGWRMKNHDRQSYSSGYLS